jgi:tRNA pseudouridine38-40 synthase
VVDRVHRMELQYDGTGLHGWAKQEGLPTVEGSLETALHTLLGQAPALRVAGRTDAGVHARRQVVSLALPTGLDLHRMAYSLNALTPPGIVIARISRASPSFDARTDAVSRTYRYYLCTASVPPPFWTRYCWRPAETIDLPLLLSSAGPVAGKHDFTAFTPTESEHVFFERTVRRCVWTSTRADLAAPGGLGRLPGGSGRSVRATGAGIWYLEIEADAFLRHMVRTLVGTMVEVASGKRSVEDMARLLAGQPRERAGPTAPARGLFLWDVRYAPRGRSHLHGTMDT